MGNIRLEISKKWLEAQKAEAGKAYDRIQKDDYANDQQAQKTIGKYLLFDLDLEKQEIDTDEGTINLFFASPDQNEEGNREIWLNLSYRLDPEDYIELATLGIKRYNKAKALFETLQ